MTTVKTENRAYCPIPDCEYWVAFGGYFHPFIQRLYGHLKATHTDLPMADKRVPGGLLDQILGEAVLAALNPEVLAAKAKVAELILDCRCTGYDRRSGGFLDGVCWCGHSKEDPCHSPVPHDEIWQFISHDIRIEFEERAPRNGKLLGVGANGLEVREGSAVEWIPMVKVANVFHLCCHDGIIDA